MTTDISVWQTLLTSIAKRVSHQGFDTWFRPIAFANEVGNTMYLRVPNPLFVDWISKNYGHILRDSLNEINRPHHEIAFVVGDARESGPPPEELSFVLTDRSLPLQASSGNLVLDPPSNSTFTLLLNEKYTFNSFVVGSCNQFAHAAAKAVGESPSKAYNPLFIYGGVGLGKTHLMHAVGHTIRARNSHLRLVYISSEKFMNELINSIRYDKTLTFREKYRNIDVLLMDDIQFIAGKERTQEEFFHTFNALYDSQKQIIISSDCPPREIPTLEERLHSRFEWGLIADIQPPDLETKIAILRRKAEIDHISIPDNVALFVASKIKSNVRELEGCLIRLMAYASLKGVEISLSMAQETLHHLLEDEGPRVTIEDIQRIVAEHYGLRPQELKSQTNSRAIAFPRQVAMYLCRQMTKASLPEIGRHFGGKHHTTVLHSIHKVSNLYAKETDFHRVVDSLISVIK